MFQNQLYTTKKNSLCSIGTYSVSFNTRNTTLNGSTANTSSCPSTWCTNTWYRCTSAFTLIVCFLDDFMSMPPEMFVLWGHLSEKRTRLIAGSTDVEQGAVRLWKTMQRSKTNLVLPFSLMSTFKIRKLSRSSDVVHLQTVYIHKNNIQIMAVDFYIDLVCVMDFIFIWQLYWTFETSSKLLDWVMVGNSSFWKKEILCC